jgi:hypothetical protein
VPDFSKVNDKPASSSTTNDVLRNLEFMKIAGDNSNIGYYHH